MPGGTRVATIQTSMVCNLKSSSSYAGMRWYHWKKDNESLERSEMKIGEVRPNDFWVSLSNSLSFNGLEIFSEE